MGKRRRERQDATDWSSERTLADVEAEALEAAREPKLIPEGGDDLFAAIRQPSFEQPGADRSAEPAHAADGSQPAAAALRCSCGGEEFLLQAYLAVVRGRAQPEPVEMEGMTCPACGREYEAIWLESGHIVRGEFRGFTELDDDE